VKWVLLWFFGLIPLFALSLLEWGRVAGGLALRVWLFAGAAYSLKHSGQLVPQRGEERVSTFGIVVIFAVFLGGGLIIGGSIMMLVGKS
jgi:hypothetical protein